MIVILKGNILRSDYPQDTGRKLKFYLPSVYVIYSGGNEAILYLWKQLTVKSASPKKYIYVCVWAYMLKKLG